jgi:hypothetical protein
MHTGLQVLTGVKQHYKKTRKMKRLPIITALLLLVCCNTGIWAQIGMTGNNPSPAAVLDMREGTGQKGLLIPQVSLSNITTGTPIVTGSPASSLLVFNTNASVTGGSGTGYYYWDGTKWQRLIVGASGTKADNLGNHTATIALDMASKNINNANKLSTTTSSIAKGMDGSTPQAGSLLTAGDVLGNANWVMPAFPRTFFWKAAIGSITIPAPIGSTAPYTYFTGKSYTAPANGTLDVRMIIFGFTNLSINNKDAYEYANVSVTLQPVENGTPIAGSIVTAAASPAFLNILANPSPTSSMRECIWLGTRFRVTKGATYTFQITGKNDSGYPADPASYTAGLGTLSGGSYIPAGSDGRMYPTISGVLYVD